MPSSSQLQSLAKDIFSGDSEILSDPLSSAFQERLKRWSDINLYTPGAIVVVKSEEDCQTTVKWAIATRTPFVCKSGGMSLYSTTEQEGIVIDLSDFSSVEVDAEHHTATLTGGISSKGVAVELANFGLCTTLPNSNPVGAIPFFLNGGNSPLISKLGYASDNIVSSRLITADGEIVNVSEEKNADLLYALRGAGQYFGLVTSLTVRACPLAEVFGNKEGTFWSGRFIFPFERVTEVAETMQHIINDSTYSTGGLIMVAAPPPARKPAIVVTAKLIHAESSTHHQKAFKRLYDLDPLMAGGALIRIENNADALEPLMAPGGFKKLRLTGIHTYDPSTLPEIASLWQDLIFRCPDALATMFSIQWESQSPLPPPSTFESANSLHDIRIWANNLTWCTESGSREVVQECLEKVIAVTRKHQEVGEHVDFTNSVREPESPVARRYRGVERRERLRMLKKKWDPEGVFGKEMLC